MLERSDRASEQTALDWIIHEGWHTLVKSVQSEQIRVQLGLNPEFGHEIIEKTIEQSS